MTSPPAADQPPASPTSPPDTLAGLDGAGLLREGLAGSAGASTASLAAGQRFVPPTPAELGVVLTHVDILGLIGQGGMGAVYKARQRHLDREVALKILPAEIGQDPEFAARFTREARALARLSHPNLVAVHDFGRTGPWCWLIMELVDGANLRQVMQTGRLSAAEALRIVPFLCDALQYAHDEGVVHRDIKPENILLDRKGRVKIADFGLAKLRDAEASGAAMTASGVVMGTVHYMAPEQVEGAKDVDHRADIYSLGVVFYEMLTGGLPLGRFDPPSRRIAVDVRLDEVVLRTLEKDPERRYQQASAVQRDVAQAQIAPVVPHEDAADVAPRRSRGWSLSDNGLVLGSVLVTGVMTVAVVFMSRTPSEPKHAEPPAQPATPPHVVVPEPSIPEPKPAPVIDPPLPAKAPVIATASPGEPEAGPGPRVVRVPSEPLPPVPDEPAALIHRISVLDARMRAVPEIHDNTGMKFVWVQQANDIALLERALVGGLAKEDPPPTRASLDPVVSRVVQSATMLQGRLNTGVLVHSDPPYLRVQCVAEAAALVDAVIRLRPLVDRIAAIPTVQIDALLTRLTDAELSRAVRAGLMRDAVEFRWVHPLDARRLAVACPDLMADRKTRDLLSERLTSPIDLPYPANVEDFKRIDTMYGQLNQGCSVDWKQSSLSDAVASLRSSLGINIIIDPEVDLNRNEFLRPITLTAKDLPARTVLNHAMRTLQLAYMVEPFAVRIHLPHLTSPLDPHPAATPPAIGAATAAVAP